MVSISDYLKWRALECDQPKEPYPEKCVNFYLEIRKDTGHIYGDDLYTNFCTGNRHPIPHSTHAAGTSHSLACICGHTRHARNMTHTHNAIEQLS